MSGDRASSPVLIVGAGLGGWQTAKALRSYGYMGRVRLVGDEQHLPYDRPALSKEYLTIPGSAGPRLYTSAEELAGLKIEYEPGVYASELDVGAKSIRLNGSKEFYSTLVIATGCSGRSLAGVSGLDNCFTIRTWEDASGLRNALAAEKRVLIIGFGFIGSEVASACVAGGHEVTVVSSDVTGFRGLGTVIGRYAADLHLSHGETLQMGVTVRDVRQVAGSKRVLLSDGGYIDTDVVVVAVGAQANTSWIGSDLGSEVSGVSCDPFLMAGPDLYCVGDVAQWHNPLYGQRMRIEHWTNASEQARYVAGRISGRTRDSGYEGVPYLWSDQHGHRFQALGLTLETRRSSERTFLHQDGSIITLFAMDERIVGAASVDAAKMLMSLRKPLQDRANYAIAAAAVTAGGYVPMRGHELSVADSLLNAEQ